MNRKLGVLVAIAIAAVALFTLSAFATDAQMYFLSDEKYICDGRADVFLVRQEWAESSDEYSRG